MFCPWRSSVNRSPYPLLHSLDGQRRACLLAVTLTGDRPGELVTLLLQIELHQVSPRRLDLERDDAVLGGAIANAEALTLFVGASGTGDGLAVLLQDQVSRGRILSLR